MAYNDKSKKTVQYLSRDFAENRQSLVNFIKTYFPNQLNDFSEASPQGALLESIAYLGDVLNFQMDVTLAESLLTNVEERVNLYNLARGHGYVPRTVTPASVELEIFQLLPAIGSGNQTQPDFRYGLYIEPNMQVSTTDTDAINFRTVDAVDFRFSSSYDPTTITTYSVTGDGSIEYYLLKKKVKAVSGELKTITFSFSDPKQYDKIVIQDNNITEIVDVTDSDGNKWYEVQFLAQDTVQQSIRNLPYNDPQLSQYRSSVPYILSYKQTERRFVTRLRKDDFTELQFGGGMSSEADEEILPNPMNVGLGLNYFERAADVSIDPQNFLYSKTYGSAPQNTVLTIRYAVANGLRENVNSNTITAIVASTIVDPGDSTDPTVLQTIKDSLSVNNPFPAFGGQNRKPLEIIREEAIANFAAQNRAVTREDLILRCYTLPAKFGSVCQVYAEQDTQMTHWSNERIPNPFSINLYCLSYDANKNFVVCNEAIKENLRNHLRQYKMLTDAISIQDAFVINFGIQVELLARPNENSNEILLKVVERLSDVFDNDRMSINAPIIISNVVTEIDKISGVQSVVSIKFNNLFDPSAGYHPNVYDFETATRGNIVYPPMTPSIFSIQFKKRDIQVRIVDL